ncbi:acyl-CoA thioesterase [Chachezhania sediminis]|uniref:acyl-CoA thioesterase n=1 Tax=Chachezhania sediminis TaxID=2599291 RepID=UPI00131D6ADE|nr:acyl-CoA thioesterase [Chachezhania sediminis]
MHDRTPDFSIDVPISFGHCDPAGIVFYPNYFRWFDRCFHSFLAARGGGHAAICKELDARGIGLMDAGANFTAPAGENDVMLLNMWLADWAERSLRIEYEGEVKGRTVLRGHEIRGLFVMRDGRMRGGDMAPLRAIVAPEG